MAAKSVDEYVAAQPPATAKLLELVRATIRKALPRAEESISYAIPTYKIDGAPVIYFAGWKRHYSLYPIGKLVEREMAAELAKLDVDNGTIKFPLDEPMPTALIARVAKLRAQEVAGRAAPKPRAKKRAR